MYIAKFHFVLSNVVHELIVPGMTDSIRKKINSICIVYDRYRSGSACFRVHKFPVRKLLLKLRYPVGMSSDNDDAKRRNTDIASALSTIDCNVLLIVESEIPPVEQKETSGKSKTDLPDVSNISGSRGATE